MHQSITFLVLSLLSAFSSTNAQVAVADGAIVPFTSGLPACASLCGPLFDVQGKCSPPNIAAVDDNCFCTDNRLTAFDNAGTTGVTAVCGSASCTADADLQAIKTWYDNFCATNGAVTSTTATGTGTAATGTSTTTSRPAANTAGQSWIAGHYKWVIMLVIIFFAIVGGWIGACLLRRRYLRKKDKEIEMLPPIATGPHQLQAMTGGYSGHNKEASTMTTTSDAVNQKRESKGWLKKART